jgi:hypothetical protein
LRLLLLALALALATPPAAVSQSTPHANTLHRVTGVAGRMHFAVPASWGVVAERASDTLEQYAYFIHKPGIDTAADVSTNVIISVRHETASTPFRPTTDAWLSRMLDSTSIVLHDILIGRTQRAVFWRGQDGPWIYLGFDNFARVGDRLVHLRIAEPLSDATPATWATRFETDTRAVLQSITLDGKRAFPALVGYPVVVPPPAAHRRPNEH